MKPAFLAPAGALDRKPPHGQPCTNCGLCCMATICPLGRQVFKRELGPCPALQRNTGTPPVYGCGLVADPGKWAIGRVLLHGVAKMSAAALHLIGAGTGCDARFNGEPADQAFYKRLEEHDRRTRAQTREAKKLWGIK